VSLDYPSWPRMMVDNVVIDLLVRDAAMSLVVESLSTSTPLALLSANLHYLHEFVDHPEWIYRRSASEVPHDQLHWVTLLDGMPLIRRANSLTGRRWPRLAGSDLLEPILIQAARLGSSVAFLGGTSETHHALREILHSRIPTLRISGFWAPPQAELLDTHASHRIASEIREAKTGVLVVALSKPLQEDWIATYGLATGAVLFLSFGAAIDFFAGRVTRAPNWISNIGAEWAWRLLHEPTRLWRRYLVYGPPAWYRLRRRARLMASWTPHQLG